MSHGGLPFSGAVDPRYACLSSVPPALPPPPMSMLYTSPPSGLLPPESLYRRPVIGFSDDSEKSSLELNDSLGAEGVRTDATSPRHRLLDNVEPTSSALCHASTRTSHQLSYSSLLLRTQLEALRHYQQQQEQQQREQVRGDAAADNEEFRPRCSTAAESSSAFREPRRRRVTPDHVTSDGITGDNTPDRTSPLQLHTDDGRSPARKTGINYYFTKIFKYCVLHCVSKNRTPTINMTCIHCNFTNSQLYFYMERPHLILK